MSSPGSPARPEQVDLDYGRIEVVDDEVAAILRSMPGADRLRIAGGLFAGARRMLSMHLRDKHPEWTDEQVTREVARRLSHGAC